MKVGTKINVAFGIGAIFLLGVEIAAVIVVGRLNQILADAAYYSQQTRQVAEAIHAYRVAPQQTGDHLARVKDLARLAQSDPEKRLLEETRQALVAGDASRNVADQLEKLDLFYTDAADRLYQRLAKTHSRIRAGLTVILVDSVLLFLFLTYFVRQWLVQPLQLLSRQVATVASGDAKARVAQLGDEEFLAIASAINTINTERHELRERVEKSARLSVVGEACSHAMHNVRSLLGSIRSLAQHESNLSAAAPTSRVGFNYIIALVNKLDSWVRNLNSQVSAIAPNLAAHQIEPVVHDAIAMLEPRLTEKELRLNLEADDPLPSVLIDRGQFEQAFLAVLTNAIEASEAEEAITVSLKKDGQGRVAVVVQDKGPGMTDTVKQRAFDAFFTTKTESAGLGLTVAQTIVRRHNGDIDIQTIPHQGTTVSLFFPAAKSS